MKETTLQYTETSPAWMGKRGAVFYFSATGNTKYLVDLAVKVFHEAGHEIIPISLMKYKYPDPEKPLLRDIDLSFDFYGLAAPVYWFAAPASFYFAVYNLFEKYGEFIDCSKPWLMLSTSASSDPISGIFLNMVGSWRKDAPGTPPPLLGAVHLYMPSNYCPSVRFKCGKTNSVPRTYIQRCEQQLASIASFTESDVPLPEGYKFKALQKPVENQFTMYSWKTRATGHPVFDRDSVRDNCIGCGLCAQLCPEDYLQIIDGHVIINEGHRCQSCLSCVNNCPRNAIEMSPWPFSCSRQYHFSEKYITDGEKPVMLPLLALQNANL